MFPCLNIFCTLHRAHFYPRPTARAKMSQSRAQNISMPADINSVALLTCLGVELRFVSVKSRKLGEHFVSFIQRIFSSNDF